MTEHIPVLLKEVIDGLNLQEGDVVVDGTINAGGHSFQICKYIGASGHLIGIDEDSDALVLSKEKLKNVLPKVTLINGNFRDINTLLSKIGVEKVNCVLFDIGLSNRQLTDSGRGFSFMKDEPLLMTFNPNPKEDELTAEEIVNSWDEDNIADVIYGYGEEKFARRIAKNIVSSRTQKKITSTFELVNIIEKSIPRSFKKNKIHPATKTFQALRIAVNDELRSLKDGISKGIDVLEKDGRIAIISFHSGEDRIVKQMFREYQNEGVVEIITKRPIFPSPEELVINPKARSSKLRIVKKK